VGLCKAIKSMNSKESVGPAKMIVSSTDAMKPYAFAQNASKASSHPFIHHRESRFVAMLKVFKPTPQGSVDVLNNGIQTSAIAALGFGSNGVLELPHALGTRPTSTLSK